MERKTLGRAVYLSVVWLIVLAALLVTATYAWFTFSPYTNVTPMSGSIGGGEGDLLIANRIDGTYDKECTLILDGTLEELSPMSTADLTQFYISTAQNRNGMSILFGDVSDQVNSRSMHGRVYLKSEGGDCDIYLYRPGLNLGGDGQTLSALRLGLAISTGTESNRYILNLDALGNTDAATSIQTVPIANTVVSAIDTEGNATFVTDPSQDISGFLVGEQGGEDANPKAGDRALCTLKAGEIAQVEYWLYLEGCDDNCIGDVQRKDINLQLSFSGVLPN